MIEQKCARRQCNHSVTVIIVMVLLSFTLSSCAGLMMNREARYVYEQGLALFNQGKFADAIPYFEKAVSLEPDFYQAHLYLGRSHLNLRAYEKALAPLRTAYRRSPNKFKKEVLDLLIDALLGAAFSELKEGNFQTSLSYIREVLSVEPKSKKIKDDLSGVLVAVAAELFKDSKVREAVKEFTEAIKADSSKKQNEILSQFISALPRDTLEKLFADTLELIIKDLKEE